MVRVVKGGDLYYCYLGWLWCWEVKPGRNKVMLRHLGPVSPFNKMRHQTSWPGSVNEKNTPSHLIQTEIIIPLKSLAYTNRRGKVLKFFILYLSIFLLLLTLLLWLKQVRTSTFPVTSCLHLTHPWSSWQNGRGGGRKQNEWHRKAIQGRCKNQVMTEFGVQSFIARCLTVCKGVITACFIPEAVNQIWPTGDVKRHSEQIRDLKDNHMPAPESLCSFQHITAIFTAQNDEHFTIAPYKWIPPFFVEGSPIYHFALFFNFNLSRSKSAK